MESESTDVERLFRQFHISEIKDVEKRIKSDIEKKKEDLRQMVGRRYQDIIEAADNINEIKNASEQIILSLKDVQQSIDQLEALKLQYDEKYRNSRTPWSEIRDMKNQILQKLLCDIPFLIWEALDDGHYLDAAWMYNVAIRVHDLLLIEHSKSRMNKMIDTQSLIIAELLVTIEQKICDEFVDNDRKKQVDALCAWLLIKKATVLETLKCYISICENQLDILRHDDESSGRFQICQILKQTLNIMLSLRRIFDNTSDGQNESIYYRLDDIKTGTYQCETLTQYLRFQSSQFSEMAQKEIKTLKPHIDDGQIDIQSLQTTCDVWLNESIAASKSKIADALSFFGSVDALVALKSSLTDVFQDLLPSQDDVSFKDEADLYKRLISDGLKHRLQVVLKDEVDQIVHEFCSNLLSHCRATSVSRFDNSLFDFSSNRTNTTDVRLLCLGVSLHFARIFYKFNESLADLLERLNTFSCHNVLQRFENTDHDNNLTSLLFDMMKRAIQTIKDTFMDDPVSALFHIPKIFICVVELVPNLTSILEGSGTLNSSSWTEFTTMLENDITGFYNVGLDFIAKDAFEHMLPCKDILAIHFQLDNIQNLQVVELNDELDDGRKLVTEIHVPFAASPFVTRILNDVSQKLCAIGPQSIPKQCHSKFLDRTFELFVELFDHFLALVEHEKVEKNSVHVQRWILQLLFDIKFLRLLLVPDSKVSTNVDSRFTKILTVFESLVDPFDLETSKSYLETNLKKHLQNCQGIYGLLISPECVPIHRRCFTALKNESASTVKLENLQIFKLCESNESNALNDMLLQLPVFDDTIDPLLLDPVNPGSLESHCDHQEEKSFISGFIWTKPSNAVPSLSSLYDKVSSSFFSA